jgi:hypothetical protein
MDGAEKTMVMFLISMLLPAVQDSVQQLSIPHKLFLTGTATAL